MTTVIDHNEVDVALRQSGSSWSASQSHGLLCSKLSVAGIDGGMAWFNQIMEGSQSAGGEITELLEALFAETHRQLSERQSEFAPLLPDENESLAVIAGGLAEWSEGFLHGLVSNVDNESLKAKLAAEPVSDIIKDLLEITRASVDDDDEADDEALVELVEYLRVAAQLVYEELAEFRHTDDVDAAKQPSPDSIH